MLEIDNAPVRQIDHEACRPPTNELTQLVIDNIDSALLVCDAHGRMLHANRAAQRELEAADVLKTEDGIVRCIGVPRAELAATIMAAATQFRRRLLKLGAARPLMVVVTPLGSLSDGPAPVLLMIGRRTLCTPLGLELLALQHHLTWAEQRVLRALVDGYAARTIANEHKVAVSTVRTQIQSIRNKFGVGNIDALLLTAARIPLVPSCH